MSTHAAGTAAIDGERLFRKISRRLLPLLLICYLFAYLDRVNMGLVRAQLERDLGITDAAFGLAAGVFFLSYVLVEIPSNLLLVRIGARRTFTRILVLWGLTAAATAFVWSETSLIVLRFLLGAFEAGFAPGMIFFLSLWFPARRMAAVIGIAMLGSPLGSMIGAPLSAAIIKLTDGMLGLHGWQWMFILEGLPCVVLAVIVWKTLADSPDEARWLTPDEKAYVRREIGVVRENLPQQLRLVFRQRRFYLLGLGFFGILAGHYAMGFWLPTIIGDSGVDNLMVVGLLTSIPYAVAVICMIFFGRHSDRTGQRAKYIVISTALAATCLWMSTILPSNLLLVLGTITIGTAGMFVAYTVFWSVPSSLFSGTAAAGAVALINSMGLLGGFFSPTLIGFAREATGSTAGGLYIIVALLVLSTILLLCARIPRMSPQVAAPSTGRSEAASKQSGPKEHA